MYRLELNITSDGHLILFRHDGCDTWPRSAPAATTHCPTGSLLMSHLMQGEREDEILGRQTRVDYQCQFSAGTCDSKNGSGHPQTTGTRRLNARVSSIDSVPVVGWRLAQSATSTCPVFLQACASSNIPHFSGYLFDRQKLQRFYGPRLIPLHEFLGAARHCVVSSGYRTTVARHPLNRPSRRP